MSFDEEIDKVRSHEPLNLLLDIDGGNIWKGFVLLRFSKMSSKLEVGAIDLHLFHVGDDVLHI